MEEQVKAADLNIDCIPTNFVIRSGLLYYVDYECSDYVEEWNSESRGIQY